VRLLICAGGTGGGVYPALTVSEILNHKGHTLLWVGSEGGMEKELVERAGLPFQAIPAAGVHGVSLKKLPGNLSQLWKGYHRSKQILKEFDPDVLLFTGGYVAIPMALAGKKTPIAALCARYRARVSAKSVGKVFRPYCHHQRGIAQVF